MFGLTGVMKFYYMPTVTDMRLGYARLSEIVRLQYGREPRNGDVYMFISKDRRRIRLFRYECEAYYLYEKYFDRGLSFMNIEYTDEHKIKGYKMDWNDLVLLLECPIRKVLKSRQNRQYNDYRNMQHIDNQQIK